MNLSERKRQILKAIVESYIQSAEPVASKSIMQSWNNLLSSATIRNEMGELEEMGLVEKPHTSAGRIPSQAGYRVYVDELMNSYRLTISEIDGLRHALDEKMSKLDKIVSISGKILSELTNHPTVSIARHVCGLKFRHFDFIKVDKYSYVLMAVTDGGSVKNQIVTLRYPVADEDVITLSQAFNQMLANVETDENRIREKLAVIGAISNTAAELFEYMASFILKMLEEERTNDVSVEGMAKLLDYPEYRDPDKAKALLEFLSEQYNFTKLNLKDAQNAINVAIGRENEVEELCDTSVIYTTYKLPGDLVGIWAVVGPTRMDYAKTSACLEAFVESINGALEKNGYTSPHDFLPDEHGRTKRRGDKP